jgi:predicted ATP-dependent endonuclease of OLD family
MLIKSVIIENFRGYKGHHEIEFERLTAFVGKNDVGKSSVLEALDIFFNDGKGAVKLEAADINIEALKSSHNNKVDVIIGVKFYSLMDAIKIDDENETSLSQEYLLDEDKYLTILKRYPNAGTAKTFIRANHPHNPSCSDLLYKKQSELRKLSKDLICDHNKNADMRKAIRSQYDETGLDLQLQEIDASKEDAKNIWEKLKTYIPVYTLFQADRSNGDKDKEVQDPLKEAVKIIMSNNEIQKKCQEIYDAVFSQLQSVSRRTLDKIRELNPNIAKSLHPSMPQNDHLKWTDVFKSVSITGDNEIPINKRGSGIRRLVLLSFFRAEAERVQSESNAPGIIYAIEEPETAQHTKHQKILIESLKELSKKENTQILITTHSSTILKQLEFREIKLIKDENGEKSVKEVVPAQLSYPSLNEISYVAFDEATEEYHNELYNFIEGSSWMSDYRRSKELRVYHKKTKAGSSKECQITLTEYIRHQIHHSDNNLNTRFTEEELKQSIEDMHIFLKHKRNES